MGFRNTQEKLENILFNFSREKCFVFGSYVIYSVTYSLSIELKLFSSICFIVIFLVFFYNFCGLKTDRKWKWQGCELAIFRHLLAIFLLTKINSFHKIVVILKCQTYSNFNWIKCYDTNHIFLFPVFCNFVRKKLKIYDS